MEDAEYAITQLAQTTMRSEIGKIMLDMLFREREALNAAIVGENSSQLHRETYNWIIVFYRTLFVVKMCHTLQRTARGILNGRYWFHNIALTSRASFCHFICAQWQPACPAVRL